MTDKCKLKDNCPGSDFCWYGECVLKQAFTKVTEKAPKDVHHIYRDILKSIANRKNVFITAGAGNGKSFFMKHLCDALPDKIIMTATTGVAALNINGTTLHSALGLGVGTASVNTLLSRLNSYKQDFLCRIDILAIDEVSMLSGALLDKCNDFLKLARMDNRPFGGIQVILIGDFCQLPPVDTDNPVVKDFCFNSRTWKELQLDYHELKHNFRQSEDLKYAEVLKQLRNGILTKEGFDLIKSRELEPPEDVPRLYATNSEVRVFNGDKLQSLGGEIRTFTASYDSPNPKIKNNVEFFNSLVDKMKKSSIAEDNLELTEGARIMLTRNIDLTSGLVNGSLGYVDTFCDDGSILVKFDNNETRYIKRLETEMADAEGKVLVTQTQYPLKLAYALTSHKSQGCTLEKVFINFDRFFEVNQAYVALSRVKKSSGLYVKNFRTNALNFSLEVLNFYRRMEQQNKVEWVNSTPNTVGVS